MLRRPPRSTLFPSPTLFRSESSADNNAAENAIRPFCLGKKNWLFSVSQDGVEASALYYSLIETAKANNINVYKYLWYVLEKAPNISREEDWDQLLPWNISKEALLELSQRPKLASNDEERTEKYLFRGAR